MSRSSVSWAVLVSLAMFAVADAVDTIPTESEVVVAAPADSLTAPPLEATAQENKQTPGGLTIRSADEMDHGRASNFEDLLQRVPGVFLQNENEAEATKISVRGSGILSENEPLGVQFLLDGLTLNQGDGEAILEDFDLATVNYAEVFRGAAAFRYGAITLGGAINLVTKTGHEVDPFQLRLEGGSFGYFRGQITAGAADGPFDYIASLMGRTVDGFRDHSAENTERLFADVGYRINDDWEDRFYVTLDRVDRQLPGGLSKQQMNDDPEQASRDAINEDFNKSWNLLRLADKVSFRSDSNDFNAGLFWFHRNLEERGFFSEDFRQGIDVFYSDNYGVSVNDVYRNDVFGHRNIVTGGFNVQYERERAQNFENLSGSRGRSTASNVSISINSPFYFEDQLYLTDQLSVLSGIQLIYAQRHFEDLFLTDAEGDQSHEQNFFGWNPKTGVIYELDRRSQAFMNFSGSWQPPSFDNMVEFADGPNSSAVYTPLQPQRAWTIELGGRGQHGPIEWDVALYRSWLRNELLELNDAHGNDIGAVNVRRSFHQGIELGLNINLLSSGFKANQRPLGDRLILSQTYTLNDFHFDNDPVYGNNRIAGLPIHLYQAELLYVSTTGFYTGPIFSVNLSRYPADQANHLYADGYTLLGFKLGYRKKKGAAFFLEAKNLTDERFASALDPIADSRTAPGAQIFIPEMDAHFMPAFRGRGNVSAMRRAFLVLFVVTNVAHPLLAQDKDQGNTKLVAELVRRTQELFDAVAAGNQQPWKKYFADDCLFFDEKGRNFSKPELVADIQPLPKGYSGKIVVGKPRTLIHGDTVVLSYDLDETEVIFGQNLHARYHVTDTWLRRNKEWQIGASQAFRYYEDPAAANLDPSKMRDFVGTYQLGPDQVRKVSVDHDRLFVERGGKREALLSEAPDIFFREGVEGRILFHRDANGAVTELIDRRNNEDVIWEKTR